jgi:NarL family two-component system response regulator YdfI
MTSSIRVLIVDDHLIIREGLRLIFNTVSDIELVGEALNGQEALDKVDDCKPDVILMDLQMPVMDGITAIEHLRRSHPELAIVILTTYKENDLMLRGLQAGARGYLLKDSARETLIETIQAAASGKTLIAPELLQKVLSYRSSKAEPSAKADSPLSERESEVLQLVAEGARNKEIAYKLNITERTVKAHLSHIFQKLNVDSRAAAVAAGAKAEILSLKDA